MEEIREEGIEEERGDNGRTEIREERMEEQR